MQIYLNREKFFLIGINNETKDDELVFLLVMTATQE